MKYRCLFETIFDVEAPNEDEAGEIACRSLMAVLIRKGRERRELFREAT